MLAKFALSITLVFSLVLPLSGVADQFGTDSDFVRQAEQSANQEVADASLALKMSSHSDMKQVATNMQRDGNTANRRLATLAVEKGWLSATSDRPDTASNYSDHDWVAREIRAQQDAVALYREEAASGADTDLQEFARETLPTLQRNLDSLRALRSS